MKYIAFKALIKNRDIEFALMFPEFIIHADYSRTVIHHLISRCYATKVDALGAGFCSIIRDTGSFICNGMSESMDLRSRLHLDEALLMKHHGMEIFE